MRRIRKINPKQIYTMYAVRVTVLATLSTVTAYSFGLLFSQWVSPIIAAILALAAIKPTFHDTVRETVRQIVGTVVGAILGLYLIKYFGFEIWTLALITIISFIAGWTLKLRAEGGITIAVTILLVIGPIAGDAAQTEQRVVGVVVGALCALIASYFIIPGHPHKRVLDETISNNKQVSKLLKVIADAFRDNKVNKTVAEAWLISISSIIGDINENREEVRVALADAKWSPLLRQKDVESVVEQVKITRSNAITVKSICEAIEKAFQYDVKIPEEAGETIGKMLFEASEGIKEQGRRAKETPAAKVDYSEVKAIRNKRKKVANEIKKLDDTQLIILSGTLVHETTKIKDTISTGPIDSEN